MKCELLAPAGTMECLIAAVQNSADAVYLGGSRFGARAFAGNFNEEELVEAVRYAHTYGVKIYVTVNTMIYDEELEEVLDYIGFLYANHVDAVIVQDIGLARHIHGRFPELELHASTQMHIHNIAGVCEMVELGFTRVVLSRECTIEEIAAIHREFPKLELEVFCYGALCISFSGQCLFSSMIGGRSGNRGECAQACRLTYDLIEEKDGRFDVIDTKGKYLLSPKDLNALTIVDEMVEAGVYSFKIEGRMKRPEYVASAVSYFRKSIDAALKNRRFQLTEKDMHELKSIFNRGFTLGHLKNTRGSVLMSMERPNHQGVEIGKIVAVDKKNKRATIKLTAPLKQGDGIRIVGAEDEGFTLNFLYRDGLLVNGVDGGECEIEYRNTPYRIGSRVCKTTDVELMKRVQETYSKPHRYHEISMKLEATVGTPLVLSVSDGIHEVVVKSEEVCDTAINRPLQEERVKEQLSKLKDTPYCLGKFEFVSDGKSIIAISVINQLRRNAVEELSKKRVELKRSKPISYNEKVIVVNNSTPTFSVSVYTEAQLKAALSCGIELIFVRNKELYEKYSNEKGVVLASYRVNEENYSYGVTSLLACEMGAVREMVEKNGDLYIDSTLNVANHSSIEFYQSIGAKRIMLSEEVSMTRLNSLSKSVDLSLLEVLVYGRSELMVSKHCVINTNTIDTGKKHCNMCRGNAKYSLIDRKDEVFPIVCDELCYNHIMHSKTLVAISLLNELKDIGIQHYRLAFTTENEEEVLNVIKAYQAAFNQEDYELDVNNGYLGYLGR